MEKNSPRRLPVLQTSAKGRPMCIDKSVGDKGANGRSDVVIAQVLLNLNRPSPLQPITVDGSIGTETKDAIREFQKRVQKLAHPDGRIDVGGRTLMALRIGVPDFSANLTQLDAVIRGIMPLANPGKIQLYLPHLQAGMRKRNVNTALRTAHF